MLAIRRHSRLTKALAEPKGRLLPSNTVNNHEGASYVFAILCARSGAHCAFRSCRQAPPATTTSPRRLSWIRPEHISRYGRATRFTQEFFVCRLLAQSTSPRKNEHVDRPA